MIEVAGRLAMEVCGGVVWGIQFMKWLEEFVGCEVGEVIVVRGRGRAGSELARIVKIIYGEELAMFILVI